MTEADQTRMQFRVLNAVSIIMIVNTRDLLEKRALVVETGRERIDSSRCADVA